MLFLCLECLSPEFLYVQLFHIQFFPPYYSYLSQITSLMIQVYATLTSPRHLISFIYSQLIIFIAHHYLRLTFSHMSSIFLPPLKHRTHKSRNNGFPICYCDSSNQNRTYNAPLFPNPHNSNLTFYLGSLPSLLVPVQPQLYKTNRRSFATMFGVSTTTLRESLKA